MKAVAALLAVVLGSLTPPAAAADVPDIPLPRGSRADGDRHASALAFRATVDWYAKRWRERGIPVRTVGPYTARGVDIVRFVREDAAGPWSAVHVYRQAGKTWIFFVRRPTLDAGRPTE